MKVTNVEKKENSTVELTIQVEPDAFEAAVQKAYLKARKNIAVPGFRKGKAPRKIIEGMYGTAVFYEEAINDVYPAAYEAAVKEQNLEDMGHPLHRPGLRPPRGHPEGLQGPHRPQGRGERHRRGHRE